MKDSKEILAVGSIAFDSIKTPNGNRDKILGGSATYFGIAASYYSKTSLIGVVGNDFTKNNWDLFKEHNINIDSIDVCNGKTFSWGGEYNFDYSQRTTLFTELGVFENFKPVIKKQPKIPILYLGNIQPDLQFDVINKIKSPYLIAADSMNLWIDLYPEKVWKLISKVNIFLINDEEATQLSGKNNLNEIANDFMKLGPSVVIIKKGSRGALLSYKDKQINISIVPNTPVIDPTGAGDSFAGGVLGYISKNGLNNLEKAVVHGSTIASYTVSGFGVDKLKRINQSDFQNKKNKVKIS